jgi:hypothetical protein
VIKHIVLWKLNADDLDGKAAALASIAGALEPLVGVVPGLTALTVRANTAFAEINWDLALVSDHESLAAFEAYRVHPRHLAAAEVVREHITQRASVDYEY